jgi:hypothetical protein
LLHPAVHRLCVSRKQVFLPTSYINFCISTKKQYRYRPGQTLSVPESWGSHISKYSAHEGGKVVSPMHRPPLPPTKYSWYSFPLEAESPQGHSEVRKIMSIKNSNDTIGNRTRDLPACSAAPHPTAPPRAPQYFYYNFFMWVDYVLFCMFSSGWFSWRLNFICRRFGTLCLFHLHRQVVLHLLAYNMGQTECSEMSAYKIQTPGNYPKENIQYTEHGKSLKPIIRNFYPFFLFFLLFYRCFFLF